MPEVRGKVTSITITGPVPFGSHLSFQVAGEAFLLPVADSEPQVCQMMTSVLVGAFNAGREVTVIYQPNGGAFHKPVEIDLQLEGST